MHAQCLLSRESSFIADVSRQTPPNHVCVLYFQRFPVLQAMLPIVYACLDARAEGTEVLGPRATDSIYMIIDDEKATM